MFSLLAEDTDCNTKAPTCPTTVQPQPTPKIPEKQIAMGDDNCDETSNEGNQSKPNTQAPDNKIADLGDTNPNDPTQPPRTIAAADTSSESVTSTDHSSSMSATITENKESGTWVTLDNGMTFEIPIVLRKKSINWKVGDKILLEKGKRDNWYKITNSTRKESIRARLMPELQKKL